MGASRIEVRELVLSSRVSRYSHWFAGLDVTAAAKVATAIYRLSEGNFSTTKGVGSGVFEIRINFGPGYRVYFGKDGESVVILGGSSKKHQRQAIQSAIDDWMSYKRLKRVRCT